MISLCWCGGLCGSQFFLGLFVGVGVRGYPSFLEFDEEFLDGGFGDLGGPIYRDEASCDGLYGYFGVSV